MANSNDTYAQLNFRCRLDWGLRGVQSAADRGDIVVVVDVLSFSTTAVTAVHHGVTVYPCAWEDDPEQLVKKVGAKIAVHRLEAVKADGLYSLSPLSFIDAPKSLSVVVPSPNGATCLRTARHAPHVFSAALVNATATAHVINNLLDQSELAVTVIACGEQWVEHTEEGRLRFALEDYLGAGAILSQLNEERSPEAMVCVAAFQQAQPHLEYTLLNCGSGIELCEKGFRDDVKHAAKLDLYDAVPMFQDDRLKPL
jgi:2-phosphosulfolactate phosphatase